MHYCSDQSRDLLRMLIPQYFTLINYFSTVRNTFICTTSGRLQRWTPRKRTPFSKTVMGVQLKGLNRVGNTTDRGLG
jgi:hypothetical protein